MATDRLRRRVLMAGAATALGTAVYSGLFSSRDNSLPMLLAACNDDADGHWLAAWRQRDELDFRIPVPARAHAITRVPRQRKAVWFARRPGTISYVVDLDRQRIERSITSIEGRHFYGHGVFSPDGRYLYTTENDIARGRGVIGVYDASSDYRRVEEFCAGGIGPHELALLRDGRTLVVALGGILTHPDRPREKLNIDTMQSSLVYLDARDGRILGHYFAADGRMSIRHLSVTPSDRVVAGVQYEGDPDALRPLVLTHRGEDRLQPLAASGQVWRKHKQYIASVAVSADGSRALATAPRGNALTLWNLHEGSLVELVSNRDVAGAGFSADRNEFFVSNGMGHLLAIPAAYPATPERRFAARGIRWDNHLTVI